jgi:hypothetical protein
MLHVYKHQPRGRNFKLFNRCMFRKWWIKCWCINHHLTYTFKEIYCITNVLVKMYINSRIQYLLNFMLSFFPGDIDTEEMWVDSANWNHSLKCASILTIFLTTPNKFLTYVAYRYLKKENDTHSYLTCPAYLQQNEKMHHEIYSTFWNIVLLHFYIYFIYWFISLLVYMHVLI